MAAQKTRNSSNNDLNKLIVKKPQIKQESEIEKNTIAVREVMVERKERVDSMPHRIYFPVDSEKIQNGNYSILNEILDKVQNDHRISIHVMGYASLEGNYKYNQDLSIKRAKAVYSYFVNKGINSLRIKYEGKGSVQLKEAISEEELGKNRYVDIFLEIND